MVLHDTQSLILTWVSNQEVEYSEEPGNLYFIKYCVAGGTRYFSYHILQWDISWFDCEWTFHFSAHLSPDYCFLDAIFKFTLSGEWIARCTINLSPCKYEKSSNIIESDNLYIDENCLQIFHTYTYDAGMILWLLRPQDLKLYLVMLQSLLTLRYEFSSVVLYSFLVFCYNLCYNHVNIYLWNS